MESELANWAEGDGNDLRKTDVKAGKNITWHALRHARIRLTRERDFPILSLCNNCDISSQNMQNICSSETQREQLAHWQVDAKSSKRILLQAGRETQSCTTHWTTIARNLFYNWSNPNPDQSCYRLQIQRFSFVVSGGHLSSSSTSRTASILSSFADMRLTFTA